MEWPQITFIVLSAMSLGIHLVMHGKPRDGNYSFPIQFVATAITFWLLYEGGFFS